MLGRPDEMKRLPPRRIAFLVVAANSAPLQRFLSWSIGTILTEINSGDRVPLFYLATFFRNAIAPVAVNSQTERFLGFLFAPERGV
jgi:hypothetical protein